MTDLLRELVPGVWIDTAPVRFLGLHLSSNQTVLRLPDGALVVCSPVALTPERREAIDRLGKVAHLYAPNTFHHLAMADWQRAYPEARLHAPRALQKKRADLRVDRAHDEASEPAFAGGLDEVRIEGFELRESVLLHRASRTLVVTDLVHQIGRPDHAWTALYTKMSGFYDEIALSRVIRWTAFPDREAARASMERVLALPFDRIVVGHGAPVVGGAKDALARAYAWLLPR